MRRYFHSALAAVLATGLGSVAGANDLISIDFESGNVAPAGSPGDGWKLWSVSGNNRSQIASTGRSFLTGSSGNDEALFINVARPGANESDLEGAEFTTSTPLTINQDDIVYLITETFSDMAAFSDQFFKIDVRFGKGGDGGAYGGFDSAAGGSTFSVNSNFNTEPSNSNRQGRMAVRNAGGSNTTAELLDIKYVGDDVDNIGDPDNNPGDPANNFLDRTYVSKSIYRPGAGDGTQVNGEAQGVAYDGSSITRVANIEGTTDPGDALELLPAYGQLEIDRVSVHLRRHVGAYDGLFVGNADDLANGFAGHSGLASPFAPDGGGVVPNTADMKMGIKSIRIGVATPGDLDLDEDVDTGDLTDVLNNFTGSGGTGQTFFTGDIDNDTDTDTGDLTDVLNNFTGAPSGSGAGASFFVAALLAPGNPDVIYDYATGNVLIDADGATIGSFQIESDGQFSPADLSALGAGLTDNDPNAVGWFGAGAINGLGFEGVADLGSILPAGLTESELLAAITGTRWASPVGQSAGGGFDLVHVPEPTAALLGAVVLAAGSAVRRRSA